MPLHPVNNVDPIEISLLIKPMMRRAALEYHWHSEFPYLSMIGYEVQHSREILLRPELSQLLPHKGTTTTAFI